MRSKCFPLGSLLLCLVIILAAAAQSPGVKDTTAFGVLSQMAAATGWSQLTVPRDAVATGTVTRYRGEVQDTVGITLKVKGYRQYRTEVQEAASVTTTIVSGDRAAVLKPEGIQSIPSHAALSMRPLVFPFLSDLAAATNPNVILTYLGVENIRGESAYRIEITRQPTSDDPIGEAERRAGPLTVWVSATSGLPVQIEYPRIANDNPTAVHRRTRYLSDYRRVGGLAIPFRQEELVNGKPLFTLQLTQVQFNVGLSDSDFAIPAGQE